MNDVLDATAGLGILLLTAGIMMAVGSWSVRLIWGTVRSVTKSEEE